MCWNKHYVTQWILNQSLIHPREVFAPAIHERAHCIIIVHNHPSWSIKPSQADIAITKRLKDVWDMVWIKLVDHIIVTKTEHYSFHENYLL